MATDAGGTTWLATWGQGVLSLDGRRMDTGDRQIQYSWKLTQDPSGYLWIAFQYTGTEALIGRYDPRDEQLAFINVSNETEGAVQQGTLGASQAANTESRS